MFKKLWVLILALVAVAVLSYCAYADMTDKATIGGQDSSGNYSWRVDSNNNLIPGTTGQNNLGDASHYIKNIYYNGTLNLTSVSAPGSLTVGTGISTTTGNVVATAGGLQGSGLDVASAGTLTLGASTATAITVTPPTTYQSTVIGPGTGYGIYSLRSHIAIASVNTGVTLLPAVTGRKYRIIDAEVVAIGGNLAHTANATGVALSGTQTSSVALYTVALAQATRSTLNRFGTASTTLLSDGASLVANDVSTAITFAAVGGTDLITSTYIDVVLTYAVE